MGILPVLKGNRSMGSQSPYTHGGKYYAQGSGMSEQQFRAKRGQQSDYDWLKAGGHDVSSFNPQFYGQPGNVDPAQRQGLGHTMPNNSVPLGANAVDSTPNNTPINTAAGQYRNPAASSNTNSANYWQTDPNLQKMGSAMAAMLNFQPGGGFDMSSGSLMGGPGQGLGRSELMELYTLGKGNLARQRREMTAGAATASAGRGTVGIAPSLMFGPQAQAADRGALAAADLDARMKGYDLGTQQYNSRAQTFGNLGSLANSEANRVLQTQTSDLNARQADKKFRQDLLSQANQNIFNFQNQHAQELAGPPEGAKHANRIMDNMRKMLEYLNQQGDQSSYNLSQFYT